jgi:serine/threonine-protein kinase
MLSGEPPYTGRTLSDVASRILRGPVPSVRRLRPEVPDAVDETIARALAKARAERIATMAELLATLPSGI